MSKGDDPALLRWCTVTVEVTGCRTADDLIPEAIRLASPFFPEDKGWGALTVDVKNVRPEDMMHSAQGDWVGTWTADAIVSARR